MLQLKIPTLITKIYVRYHVPRSWLNPTGNLMVVFEEWGGDPTGISLVKRSVGSACAYVTEWQPSMKNWRTKDYEESKVHLSCDEGKKITEIKFASYGTPNGMCGTYYEGACHAHKSYNAFQKVIFVEIIGPFLYLRPVNLR
jgi:hypothetical protein